MSSNIVVWILFIVQVRKTVELLGLVQLARFNQRAMCWIWLEHDEIEDVLQQVKSNRKKKKKLSDE